jgi:hypothetical protein
MSDSGSSKTATLRATATFEYEAYLQDYDTDDPAEAAKIDAESAIDIFCLEDPTTFTVEVI